MINYSIWCFWSLFHFFHSNVAGNKCHGQKWRVLLFTCIKLVAHVLACVHAITCIKWQRLLCLLQIGPEILIPSSKQVSAVGGSKWHCYAWVPTKLYINDQQTNQTLFKCDKIDRVYFSKKGFIDIKILPSTFTQPMTSSTITANISSKVSQDTIIQKYHSKPHQTNTKIPHLLLDHHLCFTLQQKLTF